MTRYSTQATVSLDTTTLARGRSGAITGGIRLAVGSLSFPDDSWNDFPVIIVSWWLKALHALRIGSASQAECLFMDGPHSFVLKRATEGWHLQALTGDEPSHVEVIDPEPLWASVVAAGRLMLKECEDRGWQDRDVAHLSRVLARTAVSGAA